MKDLANSLVNVYLDLYQKSPNKHFSDGQTLLTGFTASGSYQVVKNLLERGADPNVAETSTGYTSLHLACIHGHTNIIELE